MTIVLGTNLLFSFLPVVIGNTLFSLIKKGKSIKAPEDIKVSDRSFKRGKAPDVDPKYLRIDVQEERLKTDEVNDKIVGGRAPWLEWSATK